MKFRTEIQIDPLQMRIGYENRLLLLGSCFAAEMGGKLASLKFRTTCNPTGTLFNPASIAALIRRAQAGTPVVREELQQAADGYWFHYSTDTFFDSPTPEQTLDGINAALDRCREELRRCNRVIITFGTAWVYRLQTTHEVVANCHKQPQSRFFRQRLSVDEIVGEWSELLTTALAGKETILTVSPIRHLGDGLAGNAVSKATLRLAAEELSERFPHVEYFPAFEILTDDLRDYRFYADDLVHPSSQAIEYVWEKFTAAVLDDPARTLLPTVQEIVRAARHTPRQPDSEAWRELCCRSLKRIETLEKTTGIDFSEESALFRAHLSR